jgi:YVTN family beta-propeller protein
MDRWFSNLCFRALWKGNRRRQGRQVRHTANLQLEVLEDRCVPSAAQHVLLLSVDGLHQADVADPHLAGDLSNILKLQQTGVNYTNASTTKPSDSFPGTLSYLTGSGPGTTGVFYDDSYSRTLFAPGSNPATGKPGTEVTYFEALDKNQFLLSGGANFDASSIDPSTLPIDSHGNPVFPNQFLPVNTIFGVAHDAGLYTAFSDKHPAYQIANGHQGNTIDDFYGPEINSTTALLDNTTGHTVDANALRDANPFVDLSKYTLVDPSTDPDNVDAMGHHQLLPDASGNFIDPNLITDTTHNVLLTEKYDDLKVQAILNEIAGGVSHAGLTNPSHAVPAIFGMNFQAVSVAQKYSLGGIDSSGTPSPILEAAMQHTNHSIGLIMSALQNTQDPATGGSLWNTTEVVLTAKHGQNPRVGVGGKMADNAIPDVLNAAGATVAQATQDDVSLIWLKDQATTQKGVKALQDFVKTGTINVFFKQSKDPKDAVQMKASDVIDQILSGQGLVQAGLGDPSKDASTPDILVTLKPGFLWVGNTASKFKRAEHGGFSEDDTHVALIVGGGAVSDDVQGTTVADPVQTRQIAVSVLNSLGLSAAKLQGAVIEGTKGLPGLDLPQDNIAQFKEGQNGQALVGAFTLPSGTTTTDGYKVTVQWGDGSKTKSPLLLADPTDPSIIDVFAQHTYKKEGEHGGTITIVAPDGTTTTGTFTALVHDVYTAQGKTLNVDANKALDLVTVATFQDQDNDANNKDFSARIFWGDGYQSNGVVEHDDDTFKVLGSHTYVGHQTTSFPTKVVITDQFGDTVEADGKANVTFTPPPPTKGTTPAPNSPGTPTGPQGDGTSITPQGWFVNPAGIQTSLGDKPFGIALSPDGTHLAVTNDGAGTQSVMIVNRSTHQVISEVDYTADGQGLYVGITYSLDGTKLYASAGGTPFIVNGVSYNGIRVYNVDPATGKITETAPLLIPMPISKTGKPINLYPAGITLSADGNKMYVADNLGSALTVIDLTSPAATTGGATTTIQVGPNPYAVALSHDGKTAYVSNQGGLTLSVIDLTQPFLAETDRIEVGTHPNAMALNPKNDELYVANADSDTVSVLDTKKNVVVRTIDLSPYLGAREGSSPDSLAVSPNGKTLYVVNSLNDDVAVIKLGQGQGEDEDSKDQVQGLIPTAWYPTALVLSDGGKEIDVLNAKGLGAGPNVNGPNPYTNPYSPPNQYIASMIVGTLSQIQVPDAATLKAYTKSVVANNGFNEGSKLRTAGTPPSSVIPLRAGDPTPIQHVIYIIKENRTFDQELGSLGNGSNGDPALNLFGDESAPNARALAKTFVTLDNFYSDAEVSADGWNWSVGAEANSYVQHAWPQDYGNTFAQRPYDFEGGNLATSPGTDPTDAFIWNKLSDNNISYRNYGFRVFGGQVAGNPSTEPRLAANTDLAFAGYDLRKPDSIPDLIKTGVNQPTRIGEWLKEFNQYEMNGNLPTVEFVRLPNDHTATDTPGAPSPRAYVADNDYALGQLVDAVSHSKDWGSTVIFSIEDDAQEGPDHVDAHRTVAQVISPYTQHATIDSTFYSQVSVLRTIEQIVGISPMTQFDAAATPLLNSFSNVANMTSYKAIKPTQDVHEKNPVVPPPLPGVVGPAPASLDAIATLEDFNEKRENQVLWALYGKGPERAPINSIHDFTIPGSGDSGPASDDSGTPSNTGSTTSPTSPQTTTTTSSSGTSTSLLPPATPEDPFSIP